MGAAMNGQHAATSRCLNPSVQQSSLMNPRCAHAMNCCRFVIAQTRQLHDFRVFIRITITFSIYHCQVMGAVPSWGFAHVALWVLYFLSWIFWILAFWRDPGRVAGAVSTRS